MGRGGGSNKPTSPLGETTHAVSIDTANIDATIMRDKLFIFSPFLLLNLSIKYTTLDKTM